MARKETTPTPTEGEIPTGFTLRHTLRGHYNAICRIAWSPDGRMLASPSNDGTIRIWDAESGKALAVLEGHTGIVYNVAWSPDGRTLISTGQGYWMVLWDTNTWKGIAALETTGTTYSVAWS